MGNQPKPQLRMEEIELLRDELARVKNKLLDARTKQRQVTKLYNDVNNECRVLTEKVEELKNRLIRLVEPE